MRMAMEYFSSNPTASLQTEGQTQGTGLLDFLILGGMGSIETHQLYLV